MNWELMKRGKERIIFKGGHFDLILFRCYFNVMNREILIPLPIEFSFKFPLRVRFLKRLS